MDRKKQMRGITLVETILSLTIIALLIGSFVKAMINIVNTQVLANRMTTGLYVARAWLESKLRLDYSDSWFPVTTSSGTLTNVDSDWPVNIAGAEDFSLDWEIKVNEPSAGLRTLSATVKWNDDENRSIQLRSLMGGM